MTVTLARVLLSCSLAAASGMPALAQSLTVTPAPPQAADAAKKDDDHLRARLWPRPGLIAGDAFRLELKALVQVDWRSFDPEPSAELDEWYVPRRRVGLTGEITKYVDFEVTAQLDSNSPWRDVYVNVKPRPWLQVQAGKFKVPFGRERLTGSASLDFAERSSATNNLTPGRDVGVMVHGRVKHRSIEYAVGLFDKDPNSVVNFEDELVLDGEDVIRPKSLWAGRVLVRPLRLGNADGFRGFEVGFNLSSTKLPEGLNSLRGQSAFGETYFDRVYVLGRRWRWGVDAYFEGGPTTFTAEYLEGSDDRHGQGLRNDDLPDLVSRGWYVSGTWAITGESKADVDRPRRPLFAGGAGAVELAARLDKLRLASRETLDEPPFRNPRAVNLYPNADTTLTLGLNWYPYRSVRLTGNAVRERLSDDERTLRLGYQVFWSFVTRLQLSL